MMASAYNSVPGQTDGSPFRTAIGSMTRDGVIASNYFPIGTKIRIPDHFGDQVFRVEDRMNKRYHKTLDIWMEEISDAKQWGRRYVKVEIVKYGLGRGVE
jgi:3D (Asp-Asp-Asp) domain-containing protein